MDVPLSISGTTRRGSVEVAFTDAVNDSVYLTGQPEGQLVSGSWTFPAVSLGGTFRMSYEDNIHLLSSARTMNDTASGLLADLALSGIGP